MSIASRLAKLETAKAFAGSARVLIAYDREDARAQVAALRASRAVRPADPVVCLITGVPRPVAAAQ